MTLATRLNGVLAVVGTIPSGVGPDLLCGELRTDDDRPWRDTVRTAPNTPEGFEALLTYLTGMALGTWRGA